MNNSSIIVIAVYAASGMLVLALILAFVRMVKGPDLPNRILALDLIAIISIGLITAHIIHSGRATYMMAALIQSLVAFVGTVAVAFHLERKK